MYAFHGDKNYYFQMQFWTSRDYIVPAIKPFVDLQHPKQVLEVGCAEAGVLKAFVEMGHHCVGVDLATNRLELARELQRDAVNRGQLEIEAWDIYDERLDLRFLHRFHVIVLKDVIEHVPEQQKFIARLQKFLDPQGVIFFGFPPWYMPFGGHQQMCRSAVLKRIPWLHLLPKNIYKNALTWSGEDRLVINELLEVKERGISIERFEKMANNLSMEILYKRFFFTNPIYKYKFGLPTLSVPMLLNQAIYLRNFYTTCAYYILR